MVVTSFDLLLWSEDDVPVGVGGYDLERTKLLTQGGPIDHWPELTVQVDARGPTDYLANDVGVRLCSDRMRDVIERHRTERDDLQWLGARVQAEGGGIVDYHVLHFPSTPDVLDVAATTYGPDGDSVVRPVVSSTKAQGRSIFTYERYAVGPIISAELRDDLGAHHCTGICFEPVRVTA